MPVDYYNYTPKGDKKNSDFFTEYKEKVYQRRKQYGLDNLVKKIRALVLQVETGDALNYLSELYFMTPYRFKAGYKSATHKIYILEINPNYPCFIVLEPLSKDFIDELTRFNMLYPFSRYKKNARYIGEIYHVDDINEVQKALTTQDIRFHQPGDTENSFYNNTHFKFTTPSVFTHNRVGYTEADLLDYANLELGEYFTLSSVEQTQLTKVDQQYHDLGFDKLIMGIDHMATRILAGDREEALLEFLTLSNYYFWGAYNIDSMNSSTNVTRNPNNDSIHEVNSPAKVFTANNTPSFLNSFRNLPMPTENFVLNYGKRMHHIAYEVVDGDHKSGVKNIDYVVGKLAENRIEFLLHVIGSCGEEPDLKQIFSKTSKYSILITEYVERCHGYDNFFTKSNVASLTAAAGLEEMHKHGIYD